MRFISLSKGQLAALIDDTVVDIVEAANRLAQSFPHRTLQQLIESEDDSAAVAWHIAKSARQQNIACYPFSDVEVSAPIPEPKRNIMCMGTNYVGHVQEVAKKMKKEPTLPEHPIIFTKAPSCVIGPGDAIPSSEAYTQKLDYEAELAIIIGKSGKDIKPEDAWDYIFGYSAFNDISARDLQKNHKQFFRAKSLDGFGPFGPVVAHKSVMPKPEDITIKCTINGEVRQQDTLAGLIFDIPTIIATLSAGMTLKAGDVIATGTPAGVGMGTTPPRYLKAGDEVVVEITGVGRLVNPVK
jgi:2-keto-4-pentenoate hydratase/2-oxohepta-3-ene-1,7-dioic acid hydratase in catechol pathway